MHEYTITEEDHALMLRSNEVDLKITSDRQLWSRIPKLKERKTFTPTGRKVPYGMTKEQKVVWLARLRRDIMRRLDNEVKPRDDAEEEEERGNNEIMITVDDDDDD